jgi:hypothetical protein
MRFFSLDRVERMLAERFPGVHRKEEEVHISLECEARRQRLVVRAPARALVGRGLYDLLQLEATLTSEAHLSEETTGQLNLSSAYVTTSVGQRVTKTFPVAASETDGDADLLEIAEWLIGTPDRGFHVSGTHDDRVRPFLAQFGEGGPSTLAEQLSVRMRDQAQIGTSSSNGIGFLNLFVPDAWIEDAAIYEHRGRFLDENPYDPRFAIEYARTRAIAGETPFKLGLAGRWNRDTAPRYWRMRACVVDGQLIFRMPVCAPRNNQHPVGDLELEALRNAVSRRCELPSMRFSDPEGEPPEMILVRKLGKLALKSALNHFLE